MKTIRSFCEILAPENVCSLSALENQNATELDYRIEAKNLKEVSTNMKNSGFFPKEVVIPQPIDELSTKRLLVMELIPGPKLNDGVRSYFSEWAKANGTTLEALETEAKRKLEEEGIPSKYDGPSATQIERYKKLLKFRDAVVNTSISVCNGTIGQLPLIGSKLRKDYSYASLPLNLPRLVDVLMRVHGYQLMKYGCFNADPHGGNFLLLPDSRIGLIDYGATKRLTRNERLAACLMFAALHRNDDDMLWELSVIGGYKSKNNRKDVLMKLLRFSYDSWGKDVMEGKNIQQFIDDLKSKDPWEEVADNLVMASFMSIRLRSLTLGMNHPVRCSDWWGAIAEEILKEEGLPYESWDHDQLIKYRAEPNMQKTKF
uniref:ABC1 atypical kinase-like domain-containing protein n=1 Tax=Corethron hystrix TaxID=216773 RepID=A0A7S1BL09_9STRA